MPERSFASPSAKSTPTGLGYKQLLRYHSFYLQSSSLTEVASDLGDHTPEFQYCVISKPALATRAAEDSRDYVNNTAKAAREYLRAYLAEKFVKKQCTRSPNSSFCRRRLIFSAATGQRE